MTHQPLTIWWRIPCKSAIPVFRAFVEELGWEDVLFVSVNEMPPSRAKLGWVVQDNGKMPLRILDRDYWQQEAEELLNSRSGIHIVNGIYNDPRITYVAKKLVSQNAIFGVIMEAPANLEIGLKRLLKSILGPIITPMRSRAVARKATFALSASGERQKSFEKLGFLRDRIFPFGYFPDFPVCERDYQPAKELRILCIGYLEPFKGQDCLIRSLALLSERGIPFRCSITGFGSTQDQLENLRDGLGLRESILFEGVVSNERLIELFNWANVLVAPGFEEPWGIRINEALLAGLPVVVSDGVGAKLLVEASGAGEVFKANSASSLADSLRRTFARLQPGGDIVSAVHKYRPLIKPISAARYIEHIMSYLRIDGIDRDSEKTEARPRPPWGGSG